MPARGKLFAKLIRAIESAARTGGGDPAANATLATAIQKAKDALGAQGHHRAGGRQGERRPRRSRVRGDSGTRDTAPGGVALYVQILTDNRNRAASDVRAAFNKQRRQSRRAGIGRLSVRPEGVHARRRRRGHRDDGGARRRRRGRGGESDDQWEIVVPPHRPRCRARGARGRRHQGRPSRGDPDARRPPCRSTPRRLPRCCASSTRSKTSTTSRTSTPTSTSPTT